MKDKIINLIKELIKEHEETGYCTNYDMAQNELNRDVQNAFDLAYDCGRYETLISLSNDIKNIGE